MHCILLFNKEISISRFTESGELLGYRLYGDMDFPSWLTGYRYRRGILVAGCSTGYS